MTMLIENIETLSKNYAAYYDECEKNGKKAKGLIGFLKNMIG